MSRMIIYEDNRLDVEDDTLTIPEIQESMSLIFPELKHAVALEKGNEIHFVTREKMRQNQLEISLRSRKAQTDYLSDHGRNYISMHHTADIGHMPGTIEDKIKARMIETGIIQANQIHIAGKRAPDYPMGGKGNAKLMTWSRGEWRDLETGVTSRMERDLLDRIARKEAVEAGIKALQSLHEPTSEYTAEIMGEYAARGGYEHLVGKKCKLIEYNHDLEIYVVKVEDDEKEYVIRKKDIKKSEE
jgi:hypothetical protein